MDHKMSATFQETYAAGAGGFVWGQLASLESAVPAWKVHPFWRVDVLVYSTKLASYAWLGKTRLS